MLGVMSKWLATGRDHSQIAACKVAAVCILTQSLLEFIYKSTFYCK